VVSAAWAWLVDAVGTTISILILVGILLLAGFGAVMFFAMRRGFRGEWWIAEP